MFRLGVLVLAGAVGAAPALASTVEDHTALRSAAVPPELITAALGRIASMPATEARFEADALRNERPQFSSAGRPAADLLAAAALERAGDVEAAKALYSALRAQPDAGPCAVSAASRLLLLGLPNADVAAREAHFEAVAAEPARDGWFVVGSQWVHTDSTRAALQELINLRSDRLSFRVFDFLRQRSSFPRPYSYLFILVVLAAGLKILALPLFFRMARMTRAMRALQPAIQHRHAGDMIEAHRELQLLYQAYGLSVAPGCALAVLDLIFVVWGLVTFSDYAPQMILDGARFWSVADVSAPSGLVLILWLGLSLVQGLYLTMVQGMNAGQSIGGALLNGLLFVGIAWYWEWPAYVLIFWGTLLLIGMALNLLLVPFARVGSLLAPEASLRG
jgi:hypothetical protein